MPDATKAQQLKEEGNSLFSKKQFKKAYEKYTDAIKEDPENAVLYGNRAACSASLGRQKAVIEDATKATQLDPAYAKAWARLATAYQADGNWDECITTWSRAISSIPTENISEADLKQKTQYEGNLESAREGEKLSIRLAQEEKERVERNAPAVTMRNEPGSMPWDRAEALMAGLAVKGYAGANSCVWVILRAYTDLKEGNELMDVLKQGGRNGAMVGWKGVHLS